MRKIEIEYLEKQDAAETNPMVYAYHEDKAVKIPMSEIEGLAISSWMDNKVRMEIAIKGDAFQERYAVTVAVLENAKVTDVAQAAGVVWDAIRERKSISITW